MDPNGYTKPTKILTLTDMRAKRILSSKESFIRHLVAKLPYSSRDLR